MKKKKYRVYIVVKVKIDYSQCVGRIELQVSRYIEEVACKNHFQNFNLKRMTFQRIIFPRDKSNSCYRNAGCNNFLKSIRHK